MKNITYWTSLIIILFTGLTLSSCLNEEDPGPLQYGQRDYSVLDFDRIEMGEAFTVSIQQGPVYSIQASGDRRNLDHLEIVKVGSTLKARYTDKLNHKHSTSITISMPVLVGANFSGAVNFAISGFKSQDNFELILSGASIGQLDIDATATSVNLSGASGLTMTGKSSTLVAKVSGASELNAYGLTVLTADADASGASKLNLLATQTLKAVASGASRIYYRGTPTLSLSVSGASTIEPD